MPTCDGRSQSVSATSNVSPIGLVSGMKHGGDTVTLTSGRPVDKGGRIPSPLQLPNRTMRFKLTSSLCSFCFSRYSFSFFLSLSPSNSLSSPFHQNEQRGVRSPWDALSVDGQELQDKHTCTAAVRGGAGTAPEKKKRNSRTFGFLPV